MAAPATSRGLHHVELVMGMAVSIDVRDHLEPAALADVVDWLHHVDETFSTYKVTSPVSRLGLGELTLSDMTDEVLDVLALCEDLGEETGGAFDAWSVPAPNGSRLDPSGVVKGWSIERAAELLEAWGAKNFCVNAGGDIAVRGNPDPGQPWRVGIRHPQLPMAQAAVLSLSGRAAVATSATYERGAHIIDPATGEPTAELASVTIVGEDLTFVDAYATAVFVMGLDGLVWLHERHPELEGFAITHDDRTYATPGWAALRAS
jgi:FAD:protein FMN transferase